MKFLVVGGLTVAAHGYTRPTADFDLVVDFGESNEWRAVHALKSPGYKLRIPEPIESFASQTNRDTWVRDKDMLMFTVVNVISEFDLFLTHPFDFGTAYAAAMWKTVDERGQVSLPLWISPTMKRSAARPKDLNDIENLLAIRAEQERTQR